VQVLTDDGTNAAMSGGGVAAGDTIVVEGQLRVTPGGAVRVLGAKGAGGPDRKSARARHKS
jgi:hypothetical protein